MPTLPKIKEILENCITCYVLKNNLTQIFDLCSLQMTLFLKNCTLYLLIEYGSELTTQENLSNTGQV